MESATFYNSLRLRYAHPEIYSQYPRIRTKSREYKGDREGIPHIHPIP